MFEFMKAQFACAVTLKKNTIKDNRQQQDDSKYQQWHYCVDVFAQGIFYESLHQCSAGLTVETECLSFWVKLSVGWHVTTQCVPDKFNFAENWQ